MSSTLPWFPLARCNNCRRWHMVLPDTEQGSPDICPYCGYNARSKQIVPEWRTIVARTRAAQRAWSSQQIYQLSGLFRFDLKEHALTFRAIAKWLILGGAVGVLSGTASATFLVSLQWATALRTAHPWLLFLLPVAGLLVGWAYHRYAGAAARGNNLIIEEVNANRKPVPLRMAPMVLLGTVLTHLFGGSAGREGTAIQMGGSLADWLQRQLGLGPADRRLMLMAGISGGFGSVFGTPVAGFVFGMEVQTVGRIRYDGLLPCLVAAIVGDLVTRAWGVTHSHYPPLAAVEIDPILVAKVAVAGILCGLTSLIFIELTHGIKQFGRLVFTWPPLRPVAGGVVIISLTLLVGSQDYLGLSLPLIQQSVSGVGVLTLAFLFKLIFTAVTLGSGFLGGEVTPLFVMGSTLGFTLGRLLGIDPAFMATIGFVCVFAGASNTPLACAVMGVELFGGGSALYLAIGTFAAYLASGHRSIYMMQRVGDPKVSGAAASAGDVLEELAERRPGWLSGLPMVARKPTEKPVMTIMTRYPVTVSLSTPLTTLVDLAIEHGVRTFPVLDDTGRVAGIVTDQDLRRRGQAGLRLGLARSLSPLAREQLMPRLQLLTAKDVMTAPVISVQPGDQLVSVARLLVSRNLKRVPVTARNGRLVGMLTRSDVLRELLASAPSQVSSAHSTAIATDSGLHWQAPIAEIIVTDVVTVAPTDSIYAVLRQMVRTGQKRLIVVDADHHVLGMITDRDVLANVPPEQHTQVVWALHGSGQTIPGIELLPTGSTKQARHIMTAPVTSVPLDSNVYGALALLLEQQVKRLPVIDAGGHLVGLIGRDGVMRALLGFETSPATYAVRAETPDPSDITDTMDSSTVS